ncbi:MAG: PUR family DNA/RNA-binding protein [Flavobacteriaceae bacterium]|nr:PUR family DNA/RNA-binding protein [Flavobacteriaceae bacterium]
MAEQDYQEQGSQDEIFSKSLRAGRRTYFFDVRETRAGDYYLTITESKKNSNEDGSFYFKKHKIYLYKEDFENFKNYLEETTDFITREKGDVVISERHQSDFYEEDDRQEEHQAGLDEESTEKFTDINFDDI